MRKGIRTAQTRTPQAVIDQQLEDEKPIRKDEESRLYAIRERLRSRGFIVREVDVAMLRTGERE